MQGLQLSDKFYTEIVAPALDRAFPALRYSAGLIGWGSEVLGFDDELSTDHNWGPRLQLFLSESDHREYAARIDRLLEEELPQGFLGYPTSFDLNVGPDQKTPAIGGRESTHNIDIETVEGFFRRYLGCGPSDERKPCDWLTFPEHKLLAVTSGGVFHDGLDTLTAARSSFEYYPDDVWHYMLAAQWSHLFERQSFIGRCGYAGDELGARLLAASQVRLLMRLCFLVERKYAPYGKWFGTAFSKLDCAPDLSPVLDRVLTAEDWRARETHLADAYLKVIRRFNESKTGVQMEEEVGQFYGRPFLVIRDEAVSARLIVLIEDPAIQKLPPGFGSVNQLTGFEDQLNDLETLGRLRDLYK